MKLKRILSAALATVMAASVMSVGMVSVASATEGIAFSLKADALADAKFTENQLTVNGSTVAVDKTGNTLQDLGTFNEAIKKAEGASAYTQELLIGSTRKITITPVKSGTITVSWYVHGDKTVTVGGKTITRVNDTVLSLPADCIANEPFEITFSGNNIALLEIAFDDHDVTEYEIKGTATGLPETDNTFSIGSYTATVQKDGTWSVTTTDELAAGTSLPIKKNGYTASPESVTLEGSSPFDVGAIAFTELPWEEISEGTTFSVDEVNGGHPYFDISGLKHPEANQARIVGTIKMKFSAPATVTVTGRCPSSDSNKWITLELAGTTQTYHGQDAVNFEAKVGAGEQSLVITTDETEGANLNTTLELANIIVVMDSSVEPPVDDTNPLKLAKTADEKYVFVGVKKDSTDKVPTISLDESGTAVANSETGTVYESVQDIANPSDLPASDYYVFAYAVDSITNSHTITAKGGTFTSNEITLAGTGNGGNNGGNPGSDKNEIGPGTVLDITGDDAEGLVNGYKGSSSNEFKNKDYPYGAFTINSADVQSTHIRLAKGNYIKFTPAKDCTAKIKVSNHDAKITPGEPSTLTVDETTSVPLTAETLYTIEASDPNNHADITNITFE